MEKRYKDLNSMFQNNPEAWVYFHSLPGGVRDQVSEKSGLIHTLSGLKEYAGIISNR